ncbi:sulfite exporter TauE/SafE family protein [Desulforamulus aquiferis]|uniref:Probable membrane transporter protein n=1 Tax=Desulforamulus aquiferis TaxID=1397668 RepID=A0AAW7Z9D6_9FIRM|nr:sulfite exporter TauE/SafE family protein [Desulforamulus aquiferis]MDO7785706.1 sulfite exporter TauE/SafE family protein [Desulforamulus aquiferis]
MVATPLLLLVFNSRDFIQVSMFVPFLIAIFMITKIKDDVDLSLFKKLIQGSLFGVPIGLIFYKYVSMETLKITVSIVILIITSTLLYKWLKDYKKATNTSSDKVDTTIELNVKFQNDRAKNMCELLVGFFAGIFTSSIGMPAVPLTLYFNATNTRKEVIRAS